MKTNISIAALTLQYAIELHWQNRCLEAATSWIECSNYTRESTSTTYVRVCAKIGTGNLLTNSGKPHCRRKCLYGICMYGMVQLGMVCEMNFFFPFFFVCFKLCSFIHRCHVAE